ncbi:MAG: RecX family transcriptional regulator [Bacteroidales bacterium]|nr:RecX family transcriptional regulator [Bacteroidales bacterium]
MAILDPDKARIRLETLCAKAEHCESEMRKKLAQWGVSARDANEIIEHLKRNKFVDDNRFAQAYVIDKMRFARWGKRKIAMGLRTKGIHSDVMQQALASLPQQEYADILRALMVAKAKSDPQMVLTFEGRTRLYRFALQRGFEPELISQCIKQLLLSQSS